MACKNECLRSTTSRWAGQWGSGRTQGKGRARRERKMLWGRRVGGTQTEVAIMLTMVFLTHESWKQPVQLNSQREKEFWLCNTEQQVWRVSRPAMLCAVRLEHVIIHTVSPLTSGKEKRSRLCEPDHLGRGKKVEESTYPSDGLQSSSFLFLFFFNCSGF